MSSSRKISASDFPLGITGVPPRIINLNGKVFGFLSVIGYLGRLRNATWWLCKCRCGATHPFRSQPLRLGKATSCGCNAPALAWARRGGHRMTGRKSYQALRNAIARCHFPYHKHYKNYGARGISVCQEWQDNPKAFTDHVGEPPGKGWELDRINNDGNYEPGNVRWITHKQNNHNKRNNVLVNCDGRPLTVPQAAEALGISEDAVRGRLKRRTLDYYPIPKGGV